MITKVQRAQELDDLLQVISYICKIHDLRLGQVMFIVFRGEDTFNLENSIIKDRILEYATKNQKD